MTAKPAGGVESQDTGPGSPVPMSNRPPQSTFFVTGMFSKIEIQLSQMVLFRQRHETGPMRQKRLLSGNVFTCSMDNCRIEGRVTRPGLLKCVRARVAHIRVLDPKHRSSARIGKYVLEVSHPSSHALDLRVQKEKGSAVVPQIELVAAVGNLKIDTDDVFLTRCLLLQKNFFVVAVVGMIH